MLRRRAFPAIIVIEYEDPHDCVEAHDQARDLIGVRIGNAVIAVVGHIGEPLTLDDHISAVRITSLTTVRDQNEKTRISNL